jgi:hypothetical protein
MSSLATRQSAPIVSESEGVEGYHDAVDGSRRLARALAYYHLARAKTPESKNHWRIVLGLKKRSVVKRALRKPMPIPQDVAEQMAMLAAAVSSFTPEQITRHDQGRKVGYYRKAIIMAMHRRFPDLKLKNLSGSIGRNCHTTAVHALKTGRELMAFNPEFAALVARLEKVVTHVQ